jgi:hypothetical protein
MPTNLGTTADAPNVAAPDRDKCLHYYFYLIDAELGLIYLRVPTWCPFRMQFYCNGHNWLARQLAAAGIGFTIADNAFAKIDDWPRAQALADALSPGALHRILDRLIRPQRVADKTIKASISSTRSITPSWRLPRPSPAGSPASAGSASSDASHAPIATTSPASAEPPSLPPPASPNSPSSLPSHDVFLLTDCRQSVCVSD